MWSNYAYIHILLSVFTFHIITINTRVINDEELLVVNSSPIDIDIHTDEDRQAELQLTNYRHRLEHSPNLKKLEWSFESQSDLAYCDLCDLLVPLVQLLIATNHTDQFERIVADFCKDFHFIDPVVCSGALYEYKDIVITVINTTHYDDKQLCTLALNCQKHSEYPVLIWNVTLPDKPKPPVSPPQPPKAGSPTFTVLHLSDIHIDFGYKPGSLADCPKYLCCRDGQPAPGDKGAGFWGDLHSCDLPYWTAELILQYASELENVDFIYYTGDLPPHNVWNQTWSDQLYSLSTINQLLARTFPNKTFYSAVGNHEAAPCNVFPLPQTRSDNISIFYQHLADSWINLGLPNDTRETVEYGGFYTTVVRPGFRVISLNMNYCYWLNFWLFVNSTDPLGQLQWMINWLQYAEDHGEKVHILGHIPPRQCMGSFSWNFDRIVNRYENTIAGQFYGHTHNDQFVIHYDQNDSQRPVSMAYITPSLTTFSHLNPGYRVYTMDGYYPNSSYWVLDHRTVIMNLTATNLYNRTIFLTEYEARKAYQMESLFPNDWNNFVQRLEKDIDGDLMSLVYQYYTKSVSNGTDCDRHCRRGLLCSFISARSEDPHACDSIPK